jgi:hypothetical protein
LSNGLPVAREPVADLTGNREKSLVIVWYNALHQLISVRLMAAFLSGLVLASSPADPSGFPR